MGLWTYLILGIVSLITSSEAIIAYDCGAPSMNMTTLSLVDIKECDKPIKKPVFTDVHIHLLQRAEILPVRIIQCKIRLVRTVFYCGMHSHVSAVKNGHMEFIKEISKDKCDKLHRTNFYETGESKFFDLPLNGTVAKSIILAGGINENGDCSRGKYSDHYGEWNNVVVQGQLFITTYSYEANAHLEKNELILRSGVRCTYTAGYCVDENEGYVFWETAVRTPDFCKFDDYLLLHTGPGQKAIDANSLAKNNPVYTVSHGDVSFALAVNGKKEFCGYTLLTTEHPRLFIIDITGRSPLSQMKQITTGNLNMLTYVNSKFIFLEHHLRDQIIALYNDVITQQCKIETQVLHNLLSIAHHAPEEFAFRLMKQPGYIAHLAGEVIRIAKCIPVEVFPRKTDSCFQELPVSRGNDSLFMMPRTHILVKTGNQLECNAALAPMYKINNGWIQLLPQITTIVTPDSLSTQTQHKWNYISPENLARGGIYSDEDLQKLRDHMMFPVEKAAVLHTIAREASGQHSVSQGIYLNSLLNEEAIKETLQKAWSKVYGFFNIIGSFSVTLFGFWVVIRGIKFVIDTLVHGYALHTVYGWSLCLIGAVWDSVTNLLLHLRNQASDKRNNENDIEKQLEPELDKPSAPKTPSIYPNVATLEAPSLNSSSPLINNHTQQE